MPKMHPVVDLEFAEFCSKKLKRGDITKLCALLQASYTTVQMYVHGVKKNTIIQSAIIDYFEQRDIASDRAEKYVRDRIKKHLKAKDISGVITSDELKKHFIVKK